MGIKSTISKIIGPLYKPMRFKNSRQATWYANYYETLEVKEDTVFYESRDGQSLTDSPLAIFKYLLREDPDKRYTHIWSYVKSAEVLKVIELYQDYSNVYFVERDSKEYIKWLAQAQYLINNATFQPFFTTKKEQTYINTWHGTPLKTMGYDIPGNPSGARNVVRNFFQTDYLISPNNHTSEMYLDSYRLRGLYTGEVIEAGYPRIDATLNTNAEEIYSFLENFSVKVNQKKKNLVYTPTWKGTNLSQARNNMEQIYEEMSKLRLEHGDTYNVLVKVHPFLYSEAKKFKKILPYLIPDVTDTNELLSITDVLITDYSSIFFDYLVTDKPIIFYCWDDDLYSEERGKYFTYEELPGRVCFTMREVSETLADLSNYNENYKLNYQTFKQNFTSYDDGNTTKRYVDYIFNRKQENNLVIHRTATDKKKLLFYPGGMRNNGITSSFINLINNIDQDKYELTCFLDVPTTKEQFRNIKELPQATHLFFRFSSPNYTIKEAYKDLWCHSFGASGVGKKLYPTLAYQRETTRLLADVEFDNAIDFSGYSLYWGKLILASNSKQRLCFLHSDMQADSNRTVGGKKIHAMNLRGLFSVYNKFDGLVSVSASTKEVNVQNLKKYADLEKFTVVSNTLNPKKIFNLSTEKEEELYTETSNSVIFNSKGRIKSDEERIAVWNKNPEDGDAVKQVYLKKELASSDIAIISKISLEDKEFYKVLANYEYIGWIQADYIELLPDKLLNKRSVSLIGKLNTKRGVYLYTKPFNIEGAEMVSTSGYLRNIYIKIEEIVATDSGEFAKIVIKGTELGWLSLANITLSNRQNKRKTGIQKIIYPVLTFIVFRKNYFDKRNVLKQLENRVRLTKLMESFGTVNVESPTKLFGTSLLANDKNPIVLNTEVTDGQHVEITQSQESIHGKSYYVKYDNQQEGWLSAKKITLVEPTVNELFLNESIYYYVNPGEEEIAVYPDCSSTEFEKVSVPSDLLFKAKRRLKTTQNQEFLLIENKELGYEWIVREEQFKVSEDYGVFNTEGEYINFPKQDEISFVTMGRLSPEKRQADLIRAFANFYQKNQTGHLYLVGNGSLYDELFELIEQLGLTERIHLTGQLANPFKFLSKCSVFVLTSEYEGQPMVLLEAMTLGMKIISTDIQACRYVLEDGKYGLLTETNDVAGITISMEDIYNSTKTFATFDYQKYNEHAIEEFYRNL